MSANVTVVFQGVKFYWRTRNTIDVTIVEHAEQDLTEIVLFDPALGKEAPRIYLSSTALYTKLDHDSIEYHISFANRNNVPVTEKFVTETVNKAKSDFLLSRLVITEYSTKSKIMTVALQDNKERGIVAILVREKPPYLLPYSAVQPEQLMVGLVDQAILKLGTERAKLHIECDDAAAAEPSTMSLTIKERWRIPIVFIKISSGKRLSQSDSKIWSTVSQNMNTEQGANKMAAVFARTPKLCRAAVPMSPHPSPSHNVPFCGGEDGEIIPCTAPAYSGAVQWRLFQATTADRPHTKVVSGAGFLSKQSSTHQIANCPKRRASRHQPLFNALRRLSLSLTASFAVPRNDTDAIDEGAGDGKCDIRRMVTGLDAEDDTALHGEEADMLTCDLLVTKPQKGCTTDASSDTAAPTSVKKPVANSGAIAAPAPTAATAAAAEFTIVGFFSGLLHWRSGNKIYVDAGAASQE